MNKVVTDPLTIAYHELRSPLGLMVTAARSAALESEDEYVRSRCQSIATAAERMLRVATRVILLASTTPGGSDDEVDALATTRAVIDDYRVMGVSIEYVEDGPPAFMTANREHLEALICSLLGNAIDHRDEKWPLQVRAARSATGLDITIANRRSAVRRHDGLGLGWHISSKLAQELGAQLETSTDNGRFAVTVKLPLSEAAVTHYLATGVA